LNLVAHHAIGFGLALGLLAYVGWVARHTSIKSASFASVGALVLLLFAGIASALGHSEESFSAVLLLSRTALLHLPLYLVGVGMILRRSASRVAVLYWVATGIIGLVALDAFIIEPHWLEVTTHTISSAKLTEPVRVIVLADIQTDKPGRYEARVLSTTMALDPDLILFVGDYIQLGRRSRSYMDEIDALRALMVEAGLHAPLGAYAVEGNVDEPGWRHAFDDLPVTIIEETATYDLGPVVLTGLGMWDSFGKTVAIEPREAFHIVFGHSPNFSLGPVEADLLIAGHNHGGQVRLPFVGPLINMSRVPRSWVSGLTTIGAWPCSAPALPLPPRAGDNRPGAGRMKNHRINRSRASSA